MLECRREIKKWRQRKRERKGEREGENKESMCV